MIIDTHCHLDFPEFDADRDEVIKRAIDAGVGAIIDVGSSVRGSMRALELARSQDIVFASLGVHPHEAASVTDKVISDFKALAKEKKVVAIGEVGLDYYRKLSSKNAQEDAFRKFIRLAAETGLPLIVHSRDADADVIRILKEEAGVNIRGVIHCFSGGDKFLKECLDLGLFISFTGNITFKNASTLRDVARLMPVEKLMLETDSPYLAPQNVRGKRNEPSYLKYLVEEWAWITGLTEEDICRITTHNANTLFGLFGMEKSKIVYEIRGSLYINMTNRCTNDCAFCIRNESEFVKGHNLKIDREPSTEEILTAVGDPKRYKQIVFCGYGEPTIRFDALKEVAKALKAKGAVLRLVTNGHGDLINGRRIVPELIGIVDMVSVSLNADTRDKYNKICAPKFGQESYGKVTDFIRDCVRNGIKTEATCLDLNDVDVKKCEAISLDLGADFRLRRLGVTG